ncbi:unnamed protein product [Vitrella brassicaformis CCMP3155]|uniref:NmrA-like domain-containing protein n=2 Tax=Vitrella brassicaformis TaxID=1169539 RepID=A0A0G4EGF8_VITBC|nr:unnamed protein product [Vitrella brassicaformis CCMP3155]|eukprot:CEL94964.1 unnamed protein product [Vitrella brassicaformis CCMP3155]
MLPFPSIQPYPLASRPRPPPTGGEYHARHALSQTYTYLRPPPGTAGPLASHAPPYAPYATFRQPLHGPVAMKPSVMASPPLPTPGGFRPVPVSFRPPPTGVATPSLRRTTTLASSTYAAPALPPLTSGDRSRPVHMMSYAALPKPGPVAVMAPPLMVQHRSYVPHTVADLRTITRSYTPAKMQMQVQGGAGEAQQAYNNKASRPMRVLVVGAETELGQKVMGALLDHHQQQQQQGEEGGRGSGSGGGGGVGVQLQLSVLFDKPERDELRDIVDMYEQKGVRVYDGDIENAHTLRGVCAGVHTVLCLVEGEEGGGTTGPVNLVREADASGVKRFIPSNFFLDYREATIEDLIPLRQMKRVREELGKTSMAALYLHTGIPMEALFSDDMALWDASASRLCYYGSPYQALDMTCQDDIAVYIAKVVCNPELTGDVMVAGDVVTVKQLQREFFQRTQQHLSLESKGSIADLTADIDRRIGTSTSSAAAAAGGAAAASVTLRDEEQPEAEEEQSSGVIPLLFAKNVFDGRGKLRPDMEAFPDVRPMKVVDFLVAK